MTLIYENLYDNIIAKNADRYSHLRVITGYSSGNFVHRVLNDFPNLKIELYLGMAMQGISNRDHKAYREITNDEIGKIYYVNQLPMVHQKIIEFYDSGNTQRIGYVGSANFSFSGFMTQRELMMPTKDPLNRPFEIIRPQSSLCLSNNLANISFMNQLETFRQFKSSELTDVRDLDESNGNYEFEDIPAKDMEYKKIANDPHFISFFDSFMEYEAQLSLQNGAQKGKVSGRSHLYRAFLIKTLVNYKHYYAEIPTDLRNREVQDKIEFLMEFPSFQKVNKEKNHFYSAAIRAYKDYISSGH